MSKVVSLYAVINPCSVRVEFGSSLFFVRKPIPVVREVEGREEERTIGGVVRSAFLFHTLTPLPMEARIRVRQWEPDRTPALLIVDLSPP